MKRLLELLFGAKAAPEPAPTGRTIDFRVKAWGHNIEPLSNNGLIGDAFVWVTPRPRPGDELLVRGGSGAEYRMKILAVESMSNVDDMHKITMRQLTP